jgi:putative DNA primase/helicase
VQTTDATIEAVKLVLDGNPDGICYPADELSGWLRSLGQYKGGKGSDRQHWLSIWSGVQVVCNRATRPEPTIIDNPFVAITGGFQPATVGDLVANGREDGLAARFLLAWPGAPENTAWTEDVVKGADDYHDICKGLWELPQCDEPVTLTSEAKARWVGWVNAHREQKPPPMLEPVWSKAEGYCLRLALILHLARRACNEGKGAQVGREDVEGAIELARYFMAHAKRIYAGHASDGDHTPAGRALSWVAKRRDRGFTTHPARLMHMNGLCKTTDDANRMCRYLAETGHGRLVVGTRGGTALVTDRPG